MRGFVLDAGRFRPASDFKQFAALGVSCLRSGIGASFSEGKILIPPEQETAILRDIAHANANGIPLVHTFFSPAMPAAAIWTSRDLQEQFYSYWEEQAYLHGENNEVYFDLFNEPMPSLNLQEGIEIWREISIKAVARIRKIAPKKKIVLEFAPGARPQWAMDMRPIPFPGIIYSIHSYEPHEITHYDVPGHGYTVKYDYPGTVNHEGVWDPVAKDWAKKSLRWDKARLREVLAPVRKFQTTYRVPIFVGEFSCMRIVQGREEYLRDSTDLFREFGWGWTYHCWRSWPGWDLELGADDSPRSQDRIGFINLINAL